MEAPILLFVFVLAVVVLDLLAVIAGAESRDGFTDDTFQPGLR
jgi:hypothetical protein